MIIAPCGRNPAVGGKRRSHPRSTQNRKQIVRKQT